MTKRDEATPVAEPGARGDEPVEEAVSAGEPPAADRVDPTRDRARPLSFSAAGLRNGYVQCVPVAIGVAGYGVTFGVLARQAGLSAAEATLMSATVLAGAAQLIAIELWGDPVPVATVVGATLVVNSRYVLMGAALRPWFEDLTPLQTYASAFFTADENWALTIGELRAGRRQGAFLLGSGLAIWSFWVVATVVGAAAGGVIDDPARYGLDFVLLAVLVAVAVGLWDGRERLAPWTAAFVVAVVSARVLGGTWHVLLGGLVGAAVAVVDHDA